MKGEIKVFSFFSEKKKILKYKNFFVDQNTQITIKFFVKSKEIFANINKIQNVEDIKKFSGKLISIERNNLPKLDKNEFYYNDLINLQVYINELNYGKVNDVKNHGAGDYLEIINLKNEILVPLNDDHILKIDLLKKKILLNPEYYEI